MAAGLLAFLGRFWRQPDKALHFAIGAAVAGSLGLLAVLVASTLLRPRPAALAGLLAGLWLCALVAWAKERSDRGDPEHHTPDGWDAFATLLGGLLGASVAAWLIK